MQLFPVKNIRIIVNRPEKEVLEELKQQLSGRLYMKKDGMFGERECEYTAMYNYDHFVVEEVLGGLGRLVIAPSMEVYVHKKDEDSCIIHSIIRLSVVWKFFLVSFFLIIATVNAYHSVALGLSREAVFINFKSLAGIAVLYLVIVWTHYLSVNSFRKFIEKMELGQLSNKASIVK